MDCDYAQVCADGTGLDEDFQRRIEMGSLRGHTPTSDGAATNRDFAHVLLSPRVGAASSPFHPMSRRSLSQKRMQEPSPHLLFKLFKGQRAHEGDDSPRESTSRPEHDVKVYGKERGHVSRFGDKAGDQHFSVISFLSGTKRNWRHTAFLLFTLLVLAFLLVKVFFLGLHPIQEHSSDDSQVIFQSAYLAI